MTRPAPRRDRVAPILGLGGTLPVGAAGAGAPPAALCPEPADPQSLRAGAEEAESRGEARCAAARWHRLARLQLDAGEHGASFASAQREVHAAREAADPTLEARALDDRGNAAFYLGDYSAALRDFASAAGMLAETDDAGLRIAVLQDLGIAYSNQARPDLGLVHLQRAVEEAERELPGGPWPPLLNNLGTTYEALDAPPLALAAYHRALALAEQSGDEHHLHDSLTRLGALLLGAGRVEDGRRDLEEALRLAEGAVGPVEREWTLAFVAMAREADGDRTGAVAALGEGLALARRLGYLANQRFYLAHLARLLLEDEPARAKALIEQALATLDADSATNVWTVEHVLASWEAKWGSAPEARLVCQRAMASLEGHRDGVGSSDARRSLLAASLEVYEDCLGLAFEAGDAEEAFLILERARAPAWQRAEGLLSPQARVTLSQRRQELLARRSALAVGVVDPRILEPLDLEIEKLGQALAAVGAQPFAAPTVTDPRARLEAETAILAYVLVDRRAVAFVLTRDGLAMNPLEVAGADLADRVEGFVELLAADRAEGWTRSGLALYQDLFAPLRGYLGGSVNRLVVVADGPLALLPFEALVTREPAAGEGRPRFLLDELSVSYSPSAAEWADRRSRRAERPFASPDLVVADPVRPAAAGDLLADLVWRTYEREGLQPDALPFARREAHWLVARRRTPAVLLAGHQA